ncbi:MAG: hypothetical protein U9N73_03605, partial [Candidatus Auribacterota bacterium]|nr:hypothetical protein [Candidatus Auribacterota bacterium]
SKFIIISRPGFKINRLAGKDKYWADKIMDRGRGRIISLSIPVSSTEIRDAIREGKAFSQWLPSSTAEYIGQNELYQ